MRSLVHTTGRAISRFVQSRAHTAPRAQLRLEPVEAPGVAVLARADTEHSPERAQQAMGRYAGSSAQDGETRRPVRVRVDQPADGLHQRNPGDRRGGLARPAAAARAEARQLRRLRSRKERDVCAARSPAGTRGAAVDPRRLHRIDERAVVAAITRQHDAPATVGRQIGNGSGTAHAGKLSALPCRDLSGSCGRNLLWSWVGPPAQRLRCFVAERGVRPTTGDRLHPGFVRRRPVDRRDLAVRHAEIDGELAAVMHLVHQHEP